MKKYTVIAFSVLVLSAVTIGFAGRGVHIPARAQAESTRIVARRDMNPFVIVNEKARMAKNGGREAVSDLTAIAVETFTPVEVPSFTKDAMKERLTRAELNYREGGKKGLFESDVAKMVNELASKFEAPDYAKTTPSQVRILRMSMTMDLPNFVAQDNGKQKLKKGAQLPPMSPLEAYSVAMLMLQQKMINEEFQVIPKEFAEKIHKRNIDRWEAHRAGKNAQEMPGAQSHKKPRLILAKGNPKINEMRQLVERGAQRMNPESLSKLADDSLDTLGIER